MTAVQFSCKDPLIAAYCQDKFGPTFEREWNALEGVDAHDRTRRKWERQLERQARRQQWYDYTVDEHGIRHLVFGVDGHPALLVPGVAVIDQ